MKKASFFLILCVSLIINIGTASADFGPKDSLTIYAENMPDSLCYLDLLVDETTEDTCENIHDLSKYDSTLINVLKNYNNNGWRPAMVLGTSWAPIHGDIRCDVNEGKCVQHFSYAGVPDNFKIIVVSTDGKIVVSNTIKRFAFSSTVNFNYKTGEAYEKGYFLSYLLQFLFTCAWTLIIEGLILIVFGFSLKQNLKPFLLINIITQILFTVAVYFSMVIGGNFYAVVVYILSEIVIFIVETILFSIFLKQKSKFERAAFSLTANGVSLFMGVLLMVYDIYYI